MSHENWENVANKTNHSHHWHHVDPSGDVLSIILSDESKEPLGGYGDGWSVEIYPDPDKPDDADDQMTRWHYRPDEHPEIRAIMKVAELMEKHG